MSINDTSPPDMDKHGEEMNLRMVGLALFVLMLTMMLHAAWVDHHLSEDRCHIENVPEIGGPATVCE